MKLIVGLGNPGPEYEGTRHNLGFAVVELLASRHGAGRFRAESNALVTGLVIAGESVLAVKPRTYMNDSGAAVAPLLRKYGDGDPANLIVICDDVALPLGIIRVRARGSSGGQKGLGSIIEALGTREFARIRLGVKPDHPVADLKGFVLARWSRSDGEVVDRMVGRAADAVEAVLKDGIASAMAGFNERARETSVEE